MNSKLVPIPTPVDLDGRPDPDPPTPHDWELLRLGSKYRICCRNCHQHTGDWAVVIDLDRLKRHADRSSEDCEERQVQLIHEF